MPPIKKINDTTFQAVMLSGDIVEIGDKRSKDFKPHIKLNRWDGECWIAPSIKLAGAVSRPRVSDRQIEIESNLSIVRFYPIAPSKQWELGSFRMEITHKKKPKSNKVLSNILSHNVVAHYQPPLTQREIEEGVVRPDNIEGSYAFYHATKGGMVDSRGKDYKCGKFGHKPRPRIVDDNGDWCWAELSIDLATGLQIITIPLEFYEYAKYPIRHDAGADTFGWTDIGGSPLYVGNYIRGSWATGPASGNNAQSMTAYLEQYGDTTTGKLALYKKSDGARLEGSSERADITSADWYTFTGFSSDLGDGVDYWLVVWAPSQIKIYRDTTLRTDMCGYEAVAYNSWPDTFTATITNYLLSIYCTYTPEAPPAGHPTMKRWGGIPYMQPRGQGVW